MAAGTADSSYRPVQLAVSLIIDGYNLLNESAVFAPSGTLEDSRRALLEFLAAALDAAERSKTIIVFDAGGAPRGLPQRDVFAGMTVQFARDYAEADDLIEELIKAEHVPKRLTVVSSDHRIQRAARRRRARAVDSDKWQQEIEQRRRRRPAARPEPLKPPPPLTEAELNAWLAEFGDVPIDMGTETIRPENGEAPSAPAAPAEVDSLKPSEPGWEEIANPFPPGYADDLLEED